MDPEIGVRFKALQDALKFINVGPISGWEEHSLGTACGLIQGV